MKCICTNQLSYEWVNSDVQSKEEKYYCMNKWDKISKQIWKKVSFVIIALKHMEYSLVFQSGPFVDCVWYAMYRTMYVNNQLTAAFFFSLSSYLIENAFILQQTTLQKQTSKIQITIQIIWNERCVDRWSRNELWHKWFVCNRANIKIVHDHWSILWLIIMLYLILYDGANRNELPWITITMEMK